MTHESWPTVGVAGARGVVGGVFCSILADAGLPSTCLRAFGHEEGSFSEIVLSGDGLHQGVRQP